MKLDPREVSFIKDEPAILLNNGSTVMPTKRVTEEASKDMIDIYSSDEFNEKEVK